MMLVEYISYIGWGISIAVLTFLMYWWLKHSVDEGGKGFVAPDYEVPDNLSPIEVSAIVCQKVTYDSIFAELIYLANKGYIKIRQIDVPLEMYPKKMMRLHHGGFIGKDFEISLQKEPSTLPNVFQRRLLDSMFGYGLTEGGTKILYLSRIPNAFYFEAERIGVIACEGLLRKGYYKYLGKMRTGKVLGILPDHLIVPGVTCAIYGVFLIKMIDQSNQIFYFICSIVLAVFIFVYISPAKTQKGMYAKESLLGLKQYLNMFEKDRIQFHNAPHKRPEQFEELLPFAMVLGANAAWIREFEDVYSRPQIDGTSHLINFSKVASKMLAI